MKSTRRNFLLTCGVSATAAAGMHFSALATGAGPAKGLVALVQSSHKKLTKPAAIEEELDYAKVREMVWKAIEYGKPRAGSLEAKIRPGSWVVVKPNIAFLGSQDSYRSGDVTDFRVTKAVLEYLARKSRARRITVAEGGSYRGLHDKGQWAIEQNGVRVDAQSFDWGDRDFPGWGGTLGGTLRELAAEFPAKKFDYVDFDYDAVRDASGAPLFIPVPNRGGAGSFATRKEYCITKTIRDCDFLVNIPVMKVHSDSVGITACIKNYVGTAPREVYAPPSRFSNRILHDTYSVEGRVDPWVVDLASFHPPDYNIVDGIRGLQYANHNNRQPDQMLRNNVILAGEDPLAVDAVVATIMGYKPADLEFLHMAEQRGLGSMDLGRVDVVGDDAGRAMRRWGKSSRWYPRGNREWRVTRDVSAPMGSWIRHTAPTDTLHLSKITGDSAPGASYSAACRVQADSQSKGFLWVGVCGRASVKLNGQTVTKAENAKECRIGEFKVPVELRSGENLFEFQVQALGGAADLAMMLVGPRNDGDTADGIRYLA